MVSMKTLRRIHQKTGNVPIAILKVAVICEDEDYIYVDTGVKPEDWVEQAKGAVRALGVTE